MYAFEEIPIDVSGVPVGLFDGTATVEIDDTDGEPFVTHMEIVSHRQPQPLKLARPKRDDMSFQAELFRALDTSFRNALADDLARFAATYVPVELGYGHQLRELV
jgi:hypothetical protein